MTSRLAADGDTVDGEATNGADEDPEIGQSDSDTFIAHLTGYSGLTRSAVL
jgi:hypothetical protein